ncbi:MAG TPA: alpha/beta hydrolase, partial [Methylomirabilota bacterium]|nr:alpha/beta hydrolase [Methylomirabilota bacterium]
MPTARVNGINIFYEEAGAGVPLVFVHEFAGEAKSWHLQMRFFARRYRCIAFNARGYPPSDVPNDPKAYSQDLAASDIVGLLDALKIDKAHVCGLSMGGYAVLHFGLRWPERANSLVVAGAGYGSVRSETEKFRRDVAQTADLFERDGMKAVAEFYTKGPTRV